MAGDSVDHPPHYNSHPSGIEAIEICEHMSFCAGNAVKYLMRYEHKGRAEEDLKKAAWYSNREAERLKKLEAKKKEQITPDILAELKEYRELAKAASIDYESSKSVSLFTYSCWQERCEHRTRKLQALHRKYNLKSEGTNEA